MRYTHLLVAVAVAPESQRLLEKAITIARPLNARISLITLAADPELYNHFAGPMLENIREVMHEETRIFLDKLIEKADYPVGQTFICYGELSEHVLNVCRKHDVDLVVCGNHNHSFFSRASCSAKSVVSSSQADVLLVALAGD
ncbi:universal stress protein UspC [Intestinirhabdus alba]|jgi:universal stress protein C|uniref:Universal stress protein n=1 Tax=Intestinirhabdus alba TaxID=2899544 RepID=A0A6L6INB2_9ENTR|nr:universal stress protein UspC [Intestinirhabdus alba]MTH46510.1 universal stress protein UspC [Intestinirhabdus alba]